MRILSLPLFLSILLHLLTQTYHYFFFLSINNIRPNPRRTPTPVIISPNKPLSTTIFSIPNILLTPFFYFFILFSKVVININILQCKQKMLYIMSIFSVPYSIIIVNTNNFLSFAPLSGFSGFL